MDLFTYSFLSGGLRGTLAVILLLSVCVWLWLKVTLVSHPFHAHSPRPGLNVLVPAGAGPCR